MNRRAFLSSLIVTPAVAAMLAACGDNSVVSPGDTGGTDTTSPPTTSPPTTAVPSAIVHPTGADEVVVRLAYEGGFVPSDVIFTRSPNLLVTGDGRLITPGAVPAIYPGPLVTPFFARTIDEAGIQTILAAADEAGLLAAPPNYDVPDGVGIADAADTVVLLAAKGGSYEHRAYALDITASENMPSTPARDALAGFVARLGDLEGLVGAEHLGVDAGFVPTAYRVRATPTDPAQYGEPVPTVKPWPAGDVFALADASDCVQVSAADVGTLFTEANQLSFFTEGDVTYSLAVATVLPGDAGC